MDIYGPMKTWKVVYSPKVLNGGMRGVAFVEADSRSWAMFTFQKEYAGEYSTVISCTEFR